MRYTILSSVRRRGVGGMLQLTAEMREGGARPGWLGYIHVADADAEAKAIEAAGGTLLMRPGDIPECRPLRAWSPIRAAPSSI